MVNVTAIEQLIGMAKNAPADEFRELAACIEQVRDTEDRVSAICKEVDFFEPIIRRVIDVASTSFKTEYFAERLRHQADELERSEGSEDEDED